ncbi:MAG TPA: ABC transporter permease [Solirubrobacterales bacterium]|nr:ABC transporter permease [Solirubrobacterales bacterium]
MRWLLLKDLQIMRRSPLLTALLIVYPIAIAVLIGFALSRGPDEPRVAFLNQVPPDSPLSVGGQELDLAGARSELCARIECVEVSSEEEAREKVESGDVLAALILPPDLVEKLQTLAGLAPESPIVKVIVNEEDPVKAGLVDDRINALLAEANLRISQEVSDVATSYLQILLDGGDFSFLGDGIEILGLRRSEQILREVRAQLPPDSPDLDQLDSVIRFSHLAAENLDVADDLLDAVSQPIKVEKETIDGGTPSLDTFAIAVAATVTLMFVTVLLVAGSLALEREENAFARLTRGLVSKTALLGEKILLGIVVALAVTLLMLAGLGFFVDLDWGRFALWLPAIVAGGAGFAAFGAAIGGAAKEVRAASLLAFMVSLPVAFLSLIPSGTVAPGLYDVIEVVTALFPFDPALRALTGALDAAGPSIGIAILHLAILALAYGALARLAVRRFA